MNLPTQKICLCLGLTALALANSGLAQATLGEKAESVAKDRKALSAVQRSTTSSAKYSVQEIASDSTTVREYISTSGVIFAVAWNGIAHPDLTALLGSYTGEYQKAARQTPRKPGRRSLKVKSDGIVVEKWGHMGNLRGRAYVPALIPQGVNADDIK
jgi:hypothetical protein